MAEGLMMGDVVRNDLVRYEERSVMHFRVLDALNVHEFAKPKPGVYALAHTAPHDELHVEAPYFYGQAEDVLAALKAHLSETDAELAQHQQRGARWFRLSFAPADKLDAELEALKAKYS